MNEMESFAYKYVKFIILSINPLSANPTLKQFVGNLWGWHLKG